MSLTLLAAALSLFVSQDANAQSGLELSKEITNSEIGGIDLSGNQGTAVDNSSNSATQTSGTSVKPYQPEPGPLKVINCTGQQISVQTYNANDAIMLVPYKTLEIGNGSSSALQCNSAKCKLKVKSGQLKFGPANGHWVIKGPNVFLPTNSKAIAAGCSVYK